MSTFHIFSQITVPEQQDADAFMAFMRDEYLPGVNKRPSRAGRVTGLALLRNVKGTPESTNTFLLHVSWDGLAVGSASVDEEVHRKFESFGAQDEYLGAYEEAAVWRKVA